MKDTIVDYAMALSMIIISFTAGILFLTFAYCCLTGQVK